MTNRPEMALVDVAAMHLGAAPFSVYNTSTTEQIAYLFGNAGNRVVVCEAAFLPQVLAREHGARPRGLHRRRRPRHHPAARLEEGAADGFDFEAAWRAVEPDDLVTLIYTSGTTGPPKGVQTTHRHVVEQVRSICGVVDVRPGDRITSFLPAAHIADRVTTLYFGVLRGVQVTYVADAKAIGAALADTRPTIWFAVPRVWEKLKAALEAKLAAEEDPRPAGRPAAGRRRRPAGGPGRARRAPPSPRRWPPSTRPPRRPC